MTKRWIDLAKRNCVNTEIECLGYKITQSAKTFLANKTAAIELLSALTNLRKAKINHGLSSSPRKIYPELVPTQSSFKTIIDKKKRKSHLDRRTWKTFQANLKKWLNSMKINISTQTLHKIWCFKKNSWSISWTTYPWNIANGNIRLTFSYRSKIWC